VDEPEVSALERVGAQVSRPDRNAGDVRLSAPGRLGELATWIAQAQGSATPQPLRRPRLVSVGADPAPWVVTLADSLGVGIPAAEGGTDQPVPAAIATAIDFVDAEVDSGTDLFVLAGTGARIAVAAVVSALTGTEPVKAVPGGRFAADAPAWMALVAAARDLRRTIKDLRAQPEALLAGTQSPHLAYATALLVAAAARRTPVVLDGPLAHAAALVAVLNRPEAGFWWQSADGCDDPAVPVAQDSLRLRAVLDLSAGTGEGGAGLLAATALRAAIERSNADD
jgi:nicotinate-nucleotide--dimethylbenzimidazole phosphoribosyltransferase